jgi:hypothetical protein
MSKLPAFQFYPADWRKDLGVQSLNFHDRGVWFEMLCLMHESERRGVLVLNGAAMDEETLARMLSLDKQILTTTLTTLLARGVASRDPETGALMCRRMVKDENIRKVRTEAGKKGGNPVLLNQITNLLKPVLDGRLEQAGKQKPTPSSSSSITTSVEVSDANASSPRRDAGGEQKPDPEEHIYSQYPRKEGHRAAIKAIGLAVERIRKGEGVLAAIADKHEAQKYLFRRVQAYARSPAGSRADQEFIKHPATWFNQSCYLDDDNAWQHTGGPNGQSALNYAQQRTNSNLAALREAAAAVAGDAAAHSTGRSAPGRADPADAGVVLVGTRPARD